jgi:YHS domain-containing protein
MKSCFLIVFLALGAYASAQTDVFRAKMYNVDNGIAIKGYDPVAYFVTHKATKGSKEFMIDYRGINYQFVSEASLETFKLNPEKYEPQYGGWCAYAMGKEGAKVEVDPETFKIIDGKLFLFYNKFFNNTLKSWNQDETNLHLHADANWQKLLKQ